MIATTGRQVYHWHTRTKSGRVRHGMTRPPPRVRLDQQPGRGAAPQLLDGDISPGRLAARHVVAPAKVGESVPAGVVFVPFHYGAIGQITRPTT